MNKDMALDVIATNVVDMDENEVEELLEELLLCDNAEDYSILKGNMR